MWWNGRHRGLKIPCPHRRAGSSPAIRTPLFFKRSSVSSKESKAINVKEVLGGVLIGLSVALLAGVVVYFIVSKVKLDKKEKTYSQRGRK